MAHEEKKAAVLAAELTSNNQNKPKFGFIRAFFGIIVGLLSLFSILLFGLMILTYFSTQANKDSIKISIWLFGIISVITLIPSFFLLKPLLKVWKEKTKPEVHESGKCYAGFWRRLGAGLIDLAIFSPIYFIGYFLNKINFAMYEIITWAGILGTIYVLMMIARYGQTIGKMVFRIKIYKVDGNSVTFSESLKRLYGDFCIWIIFFIAHLYAISNVDILQLNGMTFYQISKVLAKHNPFGYWDAGLMFLWYASEFLTLLFNRKKRAIHDFIAGTILLVESKRASMRE